MKDLLFLLADLWMIYAGFYYGWKFIRHYGNYLLGLEWMIVATSGTNFMIWALTGGHDDSFLYSIAYFFDAFSRSIGITLILVMGLMRVTHRYKPGVTADVGVFALAIVTGLYLQQFRFPAFYIGPATFYVVVNVLTTIFLGYFVVRLWRIGARAWAVGATLVTIAGCVIAITYDFFPLPGDDAHRTIFYTAALATWGAQMFVYYFAYRAMHNHNVVTGVAPGGQEPQRRSTLRI